MRDRTAGSLQGGGPRGKSANHGAELLSRSTVCASTRARTSRGSGWPTKRMSSPAMTRGRSWTVISTGSTTRSPAGIGSRETRSSESGRAEEGRRRRNAPDRRPLPSAEPLAVIVAGDTRGSSAESGLLPLSGITKGVGQAEAQACPFSLERLLRQERRDDRRRRRRRRQDLGRLEPFAGRARARAPDRAPSSLASGRPAQRSSRACRGRARPGQSSSPGRRRPRRRSRRGRAAGVLRASRPRAP
jgi:hypothetical protein